MTSAPEGQAVTAFFEQRVRIRPGGEVRAELADAHNAFSAWDEQKEGDPVLYCKFALRLAWELTARIEKIDEHISIYSVWPRCENELQLNSFPAACRQNS